MGCEQVTLFCLYDNRILFGYFIIFFLKYIFCLVICQRETILGLPSKNVLVMDEFFHLEIKVLYIIQKVVEICQCENKECKDIHGRGFEYIN